MLHQAMLNQVAAVDCLAAGLAGSLGDVWAADVLAHFSRLVLALLHQAMLDQFVLSSCCALCLHTCSRLCLFQSPAMLRRPC